MNFSLYLITFVFGTIVGSFFNVCISRLPAGASVIFPASHCPSCQQRLSPLDLVPVLSFFLLRGRCRYCQAKISARYPLVEMVTGFLFVGLVLAFPVDKAALSFVFNVIFVSFLILITFIDLEQQLIPDVLILTGFLAAASFYGLKFAWNLPRLDYGFLLWPLFGTVAGYGTMFLVRFIGGIFYKKEVLGEGDVFLAAMIGAFLGWQKVLLSLFLAYLIAAVIALVLLLLKKVNLQSLVPFGPALAVGALVMIFWGEQLISCYLRFIFY